MQLPHVPFGNTVLENKNIHPSGIRENNKFSVTFFFFIPYLSVADASGPMMAAWQREEKAWWRPRHTAILCVAAAAIPRIRKADLCLQLPYRLITVFLLHLSLSSMIASFVFCLPFCYPSDSLSHKVQCRFQKGVHTVLIGGSSNALGPASFLLWVKI